MTGGISNELIIAIKADVTNLLNGIRKAEAALRQLQKKGEGGDGFSISGVRKETLQEMQKAVRYYGVMGDSMGLVNAKTNTLRASIKKLTDEGSAGSMKLAKEYKGMLDKVMGSGGKGAQLGRLADMLTGGKMSQATKMLGAMGINMGAVAKLAGPIGIGIAAVAAMWKYAIGPGLKFNAMLEQQEVGFRVMLGSAQKASQMMADLKGLAMTTPIGFEEGAQGAKQLMAYGFAQNEIIKNMKLIGTLASATGSNVGELVYVYGTLRAQGQAYARDLMQFGMRGIPIYEYLAKTLNVNVREVKKLTEEGKIGFKEVKTALEAMTGEGGRFNNMLEEQMKTTNGLLTLIRNNWKLTQGEMAKPIQDPYKDFLENLLLFVKAIRGLFATIGHLLRPVMAALSGLMASITLIFQLLELLLMPFNNLFKALEGAQKRTDAWGDAIRFLKPILGMIVAILVGMVNPIAGIGIALYSLSGPLKWLGKEFDKLLDKLRGTPEKKREYAFFESFMPDNAIVSSEVWKLQERILKVAKDFKLTPGKDFIYYRVEEVVALQKAMNEMNTSVAYSYEEALNAILTVTKATGYGISEELKQELLDAADSAGVDFWAIFRRSAGADTFTGLEDFYEKGKVAALAYTAQWDKAISSIKKEIGGIYTASAGKAAIEAEASKGLTILRDALMAFKKNKGADAYTRQDIEFYNTLIAKINEYAALVGEAGLSPISPEERKESSEYLAEYLKFRSDTMNAESLDLQLQLMALTNNGNLLELYGAQQGVVQMMSDEYRRQYVLLKYNHDLKVAEINAEYEGLRVNGVLSDSLTAERDLRLNLLNIMLEQNDAQLMLNEGQRLYNEQLSGKEGFWEKVKSRGGGAGQEFDRLTKAINEKYTDPKIIASLREERRGAFGSMIGGAFADKLGGTQVGSLMAGGNPIVMALSSFAEMLLSIENVGKVLNPFKTALEGTKNIIEGPLNAALKPLVDALVSVGELLGVVLLPIIDLMSSAIGALFGWIKPLFTIFSKFYEALRPLITLFLKLANPIYFLFDILNQLFIALGAIVDSVAGQAEDLEDLFDKQVKSLQDLYQVGAISGQEYERRLAMLKAGTENSQVQDYFSEELTGVFTELFRMLSELGLLVSDLVNTTLKVIWPALKPALDLLVIVLKLVAFAMQLVVGAITGILDTFKTFIDLLSGKLTWADAMAVMASGWRNFLDGLNAFINFLIEGINQLINWPLKDISWRASFAEGTPNIPTDMIAQVHEGEMIIPSTFAESLRKGDLSLSKKQQEGGTTIVNNYYVEGSVITERELYKKTGANMMKLRKLGYA